MHFVCLSSDPDARAVIWSAFTNTKLLLSFHALAFSVRKAELPEFDHLLRMSTFVIDATADVETEASLSAQRSRCSKVSIPLRASRAVPNRMLLTQSWRQWTTSTFAQLMADLRPAQWSPAQRKHLQMQHCFPVALLHALSILRPPRQALQ